MMFCTDLAWDRVLGPPSVALTIEQVTAKLKRSQLDLTRIVHDDLARDGVPTEALQPFQTLFSQFERREGSWFNSASNYKDATTQVFKARDAVDEAAETLDGVGEE